MYGSAYSTQHFEGSIPEALTCCDSCSTVVSLPVPTCVLQKKRANALHMEEYAMTNNDDGSYRLLSRPP